MSGNSSTRLTQNIAFQGLKVNGTVVTTAAAGNFAIGNFTNNITFSADPNPAIKSGQVYKLQNVKTGRVLGITGGASTNGAVALQWSDTGTPDHLWTVTRLTNGSYTLTNVNSGKVLGVSAMSTSDGANAIQFADNGTLDHEWKFVSTSTGAYKVVNRYSSKLLSIAGASTAQGATAIQWIDTGASEQKWNLVPVN